MFSILQVAHWFDANTYCYMDLMVYLLWKYNSILSFTCRSMIVIVIFHEITVIVHYALYIVQST